MAEPLRDLPEIDLAKLMFAGPETLAEVGIGFVLDIAQNRINEAQERLDDLTDHFNDDATYELEFDAAVLGLDQAHERLELLLARRDTIESKGVSAQLAEYYATLGRVCIRQALRQRLADREP